MPNLIEERVKQARAGDNPTVVGRMSSGWLVLGDSQFIPGYCILLADPVVSSVNDLAPKDRAAFLEDMSKVGDALLHITDSFRINYSILGNTDPALHVHIFPRYETESDERVGGPVWLYDRDARGSVPFDPVRDAGLMSTLYRELNRVSAISEPGAHVDRSLGARGHLALSGRAPRKG